MKKLFICTALIVGLGACSTEKGMETKLIGNIDTTQEPGVDFSSIQQEGGRRPTL